MLQPKAPALADAKIAAIL